MANRVYEGEPIVYMDPINKNADLTTEFYYGDRYGVGIVASENAGIGRYEIQTTG